MVLPTDQDAALAIVSRRRSARRASVACSGLAVDDLAWPAFGGWNGVVRSFRCRPFATLRPADRCHRRDRRSSSPAWLRSCRSRSRVMVCRMRADRERQSMAIDNRHDFQAFSPLRCPDFCPTALRHDEGRIDEALLFVQRASLAKLVRDIPQHPAQNLVAAPSLKAPMHSFVVRIALRQHGPLRACVEYPQHRFQHMAGRDQLASRTSIGNVLFRKMIPEALPMSVREPNHLTFIAERQQPVILR